MVDSRNGLSNTSDLIPYQECLIPNTRLEIQLQLRNIANWVLVPVDLLLALLSSLSNLLVFIAVARTKSLQHPSLLLMCSLSVSDLLWAMLCFYRDIKKVAHRYFCPEKLEGEYYIAILCCFATLSNLAVISRDRYRAVSRPWSYRIHLSTSRVIKHALVAWLSSVAGVGWVFALTRLRPNDRKLPNAIGLFFYGVCISMILAYYGGILLANKRHTHNMPVDAKEISIILNREKRLALTVGFILLALVVSFLPALFTPVILTVMGFRNKDPFRPFFTPLITLNGVINPLLNYGRNKDMRRVVRGFMGCAERNSQVMAAAFDGSQPQQSNPTVNPEELSERRETAAQETKF